MADRFKLKYKDEDGEFWLGKQDKQFVLHPVDSPIPDGYAFITYGAFNADEALKRLNLNRHHWEAVKDENLDWRPGEVEIPIVVIP